MKMNTVTQNNGYAFGYSDWKDSIGCGIRTEGCILMYCIEGSALVSVEFKPRIIRKGDIIVIFPDTTFIVTDVSKLFKVRFVELYAKIFDEVTVTLSSEFLDMIYGTPVFHIDSEYMELWKIWEMQFVRITEHDNQQLVYVMLRNLMQNFFIELENIVMSERMRDHFQPINASRRLFYKFCRLLVENCHSQHDVKFYADKLCITPYYLSQITGKTLNLSPKELIDRQIIMEMKRVLITTDLSIKEISTHFHFDTMSYMARYFRRHTGQNPNEYRRGKSL